MPNPSKNSIDEINRAVVRSTEQEIDRAFSDIFETPQSHARLPEQVFVNNFLPFFSGKVKDNRDLNISTHWIALAGSAMSPVDIIDDNNKVLYTVPPLMSTDFLNTQQNLRGRTFNEIFNKAREQANRIPVLGEKIIANEGSDKIKTFKPEVKSQDVDNWNKIFERYNVKTPDANQSTHRRTGPQIDDELDFG